LHLDPVGPRPAGRNGPLRDGNPRGNPNLAPRCGARAKVGHACRSPAMASGRCRMHGGKSTRPRPPESRARIAAARTTQGAYAQTGHDRELRASSQRNGILQRRSWLRVAALNHLPWLPAVFVARLRTDNTPELNAPPMRRSSLGYAPAAGINFPTGSRCKVAGSSGACPMQRGTGCVGAVCAGAVADVAWAEGRGGAGACRGGGAGPVEGGHRPRAEDQAADEVAGSGGADRESRKDAMKGLPVGGFPDCAVCDDGGPASKAVLDAGPVPGMTGSAGGGRPQTADCARDGKCLLQRGTVPQGVSIAVVDAGPAPGMTGGERVRRRAGRGELRTQWQKPHATWCGGGGERGSRGWPAMTRRETCASSDSEYARRDTRSDKCLMQRGAVRFGEKPVRWRLSDSTARKASAVDSLLAQAHRARESNCRDGGPRGEAGREGLAPGGGGRPTAHGGGRRSAGGPLYVAGGDCRGHRAMGCLAGPGVMGGCRGAGSCSRPRPGYRAYRPFIPPPNLGPLRGPDPQGEWEK
jgi:hypothetical protein